MSCRLVQEAFLQCICGKNTHCNKSNGTNQLKLIKAAFHFAHVCPVPSAVPTDSLESLSHSKLAETVCASLESVPGHF